jgi:hypothetical protein
MARSEFVTVGFILVFIGLIIGILGYNKTQPSGAEQVIGFLERASGQKAPVELQAPKTEGYLMLVGGGVTLVVGLGLILRSRTAATSRDER